MLSHFNIFVEQLLGQFFAFTFCIHVCNGDAIRRAELNVLWIWSICLCTSDDATRRGLRLFWFQNGSSLQHVSDRLVNCGRIYL